tara:strand:+ start:2369 stop:3463 length:1095 start_codon:yes stop_codon:yes gene_type:complete
MLYNKDSNPYIGNTAPLVTDELDVIKDYKNFHQTQKNVVAEPKLEKQDLRTLNTITPKMGKGGAFITSSIKKYNPGGEITPIGMSNDFGSDIGEGFNFSEIIGDNPVGSYSDTEGNIYDMGDGGVGSSGVKFGGFTPAGVASSALSIGTNLAEAKSLKKEFNKDLDDSQEVDKNALKQIASDQRTAQGEAIGESAGNVIGAFLGMPGLGGKVGKGVGKFLSKFKGKKYKSKIEAKYRKEKGENLDYKTGVARQSDRQDEMAAEQSAQMKYLSDIGVAKYGGNFNGLVKGKRHEEGGVMMYKDGAPIAEVEGDEYVINNDILKDKPESKKKFSIQGTPVQIASALNSIKKYGVNSHPGGVVKQVS